MSEQNEGPDASTPPKKKAAKRKTASRKTAAKKADVTAADAAPAAGAELVSELRAGMIELQKQNDARIQAQEDKLATLLQGLEATFRHIHSDSQNREQANSTIFEKVSESIVLSSEEARKEYGEMERLQEKKLEAERRAYDRSVTRARWIAIPGTILGVIAIIYMFYTVNVMERAMTSMSKDMALMRADMGTMTARVSDMSTEVASMTQMSENMTVMASQVGIMSAQMGEMTHDIKVMTHNVAPAMMGIRRSIPWAP